MRGRRAVKGGGKGCGVRRRRVGCEVHRWCVCVWVGVGEGVCVSVYVCVCVCVSLIKGGGLIIITFQLTIVKIQLEISSLISITLIVGVNVCE